MLGIYLTRNTLVTPKHLTFCKWHPITFLENFTILDAIQFQHTHKRHETWKNCFLKKDIHIQNDENVFFLFIYVIFIYIFYKIKNKYETYVKSMRKDLKEGWEPSNKHGLQYLCFYICIYVQDKFIHLLSLKRTVQKKKPRTNKRENKSESQIQ